MSAPEKTDAFWFVVQRDIPGMHAIVNDHVMVGNADVWVCRRRYGEQDTSTATEVLRVLETKEGVRVLETEEGLRVLETEEGVWVCRRHGSTLGREYEAYLEPRGTREDHHFFAFDGGTHLTLLD